MTTPKNQKPGEKPKTLLCRRGEALRWLQISEQYWDILTAAYVVSSVYLKPGGRAFYNVAEIDRKIYQPMLKGESIL